MADLFAWLDLHSGAGIFLLTIVLAAATIWYAKSAKDQVEELVRGRLAGIKPYMHVVAASHGGKPDNYLEGLVIHVEIVNFGSGPAIDLITELHHPRLTFSSVTPPSTVSPPNKYIAQFVAHPSSTDLGDSRELTFIAEYRDLAGNWWCTRSPATLGYTRQADGTYSDPSIAFRVQEEKILELPKGPTIQRVVTAEDVTVPNRAFKT